MMYGGKIWHDSRINKFFVLIVGYDLDLEENVTTENVDAFLDALTDDIKPKQIYISNRSFDQSEEAKDYLLKVMDGGYELLSACLETEFREAVFRPPFSNLT